MTASAGATVLCSVCRVYQGFDIWVVVCVGVWPLWCYSVLFVGYIKALISELWSVLELAPMMLLLSVCRIYQGFDIRVVVCVGVWPLWYYSVLFVEYIKVLISELWSVLACGPYDVTLFSCRISQGFDIWVVVCAGVWPLWCYSVLFVGYIRALISELWSMLECGSYDVPLFCL